VVVRAEEGAVARVEAARVTVKAAAAKAVAKVVGVMEGARV